MYGIELSRAVHNTVGVSAARRIQARKLLPGHLHGITTISLKSLHSLSLVLSLSLLLSAERRGSVYVELDLPSAI